MIIIIQITKEEAMAIREKGINAGIVRTCIQKSKRHKYYAVETREVMRLIRRMRGETRGK